MKKAKLCIFGALVACAFIVSPECMAKKKLFLITSGNENLQKLTPITEGSQSQGIGVGGGYDSPEVFVVIRQNGYDNIYKKENPVSPAMVQMTSGNNHNIQPASCAKTDRVAFSKYTVGARTRDIFMVPATQGTALIPVTETADANEWSPSLSPDGQILCYGKTYATFNGDIITVESEIWTKNIKTGESSLIGKGMNPKISPDGKHVVYAKAANSSESSIWVMNIDGTNAKQITTGAKKQVANFPCWSPDGKKIAFESYAGDVKKDFDIYVVNEDGTGLMQLTTNESNDRLPFWSSDNYIYFVSDRGAKKGSYQVWRFLYGDAI